ncbi:MAG: hypothetical protein P8107_13430 [Spirochaetia bacterium]|jgi:hypothetical protein
MLDKQTHYTIEELKALLNYYIDNNGAILGKTYFKKHLYKGNKLLPPGMDSIGRFLNDFVYN